MFICHVAPPSCPRVCLDVSCLCIDRQIPLPLLTFSVSAPKKKHKTQHNTTQQAGEQLVQAYLALRGSGGEGKTITATPRQLESLIRLSEALAKIRLSRWEGGFGLGVVSFFLKGKWAFSFLSPLQSTDINTYDPP